MANTSEKSDNLKETPQPAGESEKSSIQPKELPTQLTEQFIQKNHQHKLQYHL